MWGRRRTGGGGGNHRTSSGLQDPAVAAHATGMQPTPLQCTGGVQGRHGYMGPHPPLSSTDQERLTPVSNCLEVRSHRALPLIGRNSLPSLVNLRTDEPIRGSVGRVRPRRTLLTDKLSSKGYFKSFAFRNIINRFGKEARELFQPKWAFVHGSEAAPVRLASSSVNNHLNDDVQHLW